MKQLMGMLLGDIRVIVRKDRDRDISYRFWAIQTGSLYLMMSPMIPLSDKGGNNSTKISGIMRRVTVLLAPIIKAEAS